MADTKNSALLRALREMKGEIAAEVRELVEENVAKHAERKVPAAVQQSAKPQREEAPKLKNGAAKWLQYSFAAGSPFGAADYAKRIGDNEFVRALGQDTLAGGGALIPPQFSAEVVEGLFKKSVVRQSGIRSVPMNGSLVLPYFDSAATASYVAEAAAKTESSPTVGRLQLAEKKLVALAAESNEMLRNIDPRSQQMLQENLVAAVSEKEDATFLRSLGVSGEPKGMRYWSQNTQATAGKTTANIYTDLGKAVQLLMDDKVPIGMDECCWFISPRSWRALLTAVDSNSNLAFQEQLSQGMLWGYPVYWTQNIPDNLGSGTDESEVYFVNTRGPIIGERDGFEVDVIADAAYSNSSGTVVAGASTYESVIRVVASHDFGCRWRGYEVGVITGVQWGT